MSPNDRFLIEAAISSLAYDKWLARGQPQDGGMQDWLDAESEFLKTYTIVSKIAERRVLMEHAVTHVLAGSTEIGAAAPKIVEAICDNLGWDLGAIWTLNPNAEVLRCVDVWHAPSLQAPAFAEICRRSEFGKGIGLPGRVWTSGAPVWIPDVTRDSDFPRAETAVEVGLHGAFGFPIFDGPQFLGVLEFYSRDIQEPDDHLLEMIGAIACQISQFIERRRAEEAIRDREREFALARQIQLSLLPHSMPVLAGVAFGSACEFAQETGGDYFDFFPINNSELGIAIGDASGHGIAAALIMVEVRALLRALVFAHADPGVVLTLANRCLAEDLPTDRFVTMFFARFDPDDRSLTYCSAGHCPGYVFNEHGEVRLVLRSTGLPLGMIGDADQFSAATIALAPGDLLFLHTDGITEAASPANGRFRVERALEIVRAHHHEPPDAIARALLRAVADFSGGVPQRDDCTMVIIRFNPAY